MRCGRSYIAGADNRDFLSCAHLSSPYFPKVS